MKNKLAAIMAKEGKIIIPAEKTRNGEIFELDVNGLCFKDFTKFAAMSEKNDYEGAVNFLLFTTFRKSLPKEGEENGLSDIELQEMIDGVDGLIASEIVKKVMDISGVETEVPKKDLEVVGREEKKQLGVSKQK